MRIRKNMCCTGCASHEQSDDGEQDLAEKKEKAIETEMHRERARETKRERNTK